MCSFFEKALKALGHYFVFLSKEKMSEKLSQYKKKRQSILYCIKEGLKSGKKMIIIDGISKLKSSLNLEFLSKAQDIQFEPFVNKLFRTKSVYIQEIKYELLKDEKFQNLEHEVEKKK